MTSIRCPICRVAVTGDGETSLTHNLRDHMASAHEIKDLCELSKMAMPQNRELTAPLRTGGLMIGRTSREGPCHRRWR